MIAGVLQLTDVNALARTSWLSNNVLTTHLYRRAKDSRRSDGTPFVVLAAGRGNLTALRQFIDAGAPVNIGDSAERTAVQICAIHGHVAAAQLLISNGADVSTTDKYGFSPLHEAILAKHPDDVMVGLLIHSGANIEAKHRGLGTALHTAAAYGTTFAVRTLIDHGADTRNIDRYGCTALHRAALHGCAATVRFLLDVGLAVDATDYRGRTPLHCAARSGEAQSVEVLLQSGANVNASNIFRDTPLHFAVGYRGAEATARRVVRLGLAMPYSLHRARKCAARLVEDRFEGRRFTENDLAVITNPSSVVGRRNDPIIEQLLAAGADISATNVDDCSPLLWAVIRTSYWPDQRIRPARGEEAFFVLKKSSGRIKIVPVDEV